MILNSIYDAIQMPEKKSGPWKALDETLSFHCLKFDVVILIKEGIFHSEDKYRSEWPRLVFALFSEYYKIGTISTSLNT